MSRDASLRWAAGCGAFATLVLGGLLAVRDHSLLSALAVAPLAVGLVGLSAQKTWGGFVTFGGATLILVAHAVGELPLFIATVAVGGLAVATPALVRATRFDAPAAAVWLALSGLCGSGSALAWDELSVAEDAPRPSPCEGKTLASPSWHIRVDWNHRSWNERRYDRW